MNKLTLVCIQMFVLTGVLGGTMIPPCLPNFPDLKNNSQCYLILCAPYEEVMSNICSSTQKSMFEEASEKPKINHCRPRNFHCTGNADCCSGVCRPISMNNPRGRCAS